MNEASPIFDWPPEDDDVPGAASRLDEILSRGQVESLILRVRSFDAEDLQPLVDTIGITSRPALRKLVLAEYGEPLGDWVEGGEPYSDEWAPLGDLSRIWRHLSALEELTLQGQSMTLGAIDLPRVKSVAIRGTLSPEDLASIGSARWPNVERLEIFFGDPELGAEGSMDDIAPILQGVGLPKLQHLGLRYCAFIDDVVARLDHIAVLPRLRSLDLSMSDLSSDGRARLQEQDELLAHLETLQVDT